MVHTIIKNKKLACSNAQLPLKSEIVWNGHLWCFYCFAIDFAFFIALNNLLQHAPIMHLTIFLASTFVSRAILCFLAIVFVFVRHLVRDTKTRCAQPFSEHRRRKTNNTQTKQPILLLLSSSFTKERSCIIVCKRMSFPTRQPVGCFVHHKHKWLLTTLCVSQNAQGNLEIVI